MTARYVIILLNKLEQNLLFFFSNRKYVVQQSLWEVMGVHTQV